MHRRPSFPAGGNSIPADVHRLSFRRNVTVKQLRTIISLPETYACASRVKIVYWLADARYVSKFGFIEAPLVNVNWNLGMRVFFCGIYGCTTSHCNLESMKRNYYSTPHHAFFFTGKTHLVMVIHWDEFDPAIGPLQGPRGWELDDTCIVKPSGIKAATREAHAQVVNCSITNIFMIHWLLNTSFDPPLPRRLDAAMIHSYTRAIVWLGLTSLVLSIPVEPNTEKTNDSPNGYLPRC